MPNLLNKDLVKKIVSGYESVFEVSSDPLIITDFETGEVIECNSHFEKLTGFKHDEIVKMNQADLFLYKSLFQAKKGSVTDFESIILHKDGRKLQVLVSTQLFSFHNRSLIMSFVSDMNPVLKQKEQIKNFYRHMDRSETDFVSLASHQMRAPITAINWYSEMLLSGEAGKLNSEQEKYFKVVYDSSQLMIKLINGLLNVSRIELGTISVNPELISIQKYVETAISFLKYRMDEKKQNITVTYATNISEIVADPDIMTLVFRSLLQNAIEYTPNGGSISIEILSDNKNMTIKITDTGYGIPESQQSKIFTKLFRADNIKSRYSNGVGLSLYMIKTVLEQNNGKITFDSTENSGSTFRVSIPLGGMKKKTGIRRLST